MYIGYQLYILPMEKDSWLGILAWLKSLKSHTGGLWSTFHLTHASVPSERCISLGLQSLSKIKIGFQYLNIGRLPREIWILGFLWDMGLSGNTGALFSSRKPWLEPSSCFTRGMWSLAAQILCSLYLVKASLTVITCMTLEWFVYNFPGSECCLLPEGSHRLLKTDVYKTSNPKS